MPERGSGDSIIDERWLLANVPLTSFFCENDALYTMRFLTAGNGQAFGYSLDEFVDNKHYFAASTVHPEDQDIVDSHAEQAAAGGRPVVSRYRLVQADGEPVPVLLISQGVLDEGGATLGLAGCVIDLGATPELQGGPGLLSELRVPDGKRKGARRTDRPDAAWVAAELPVLCFFAENDAQYTVKAMTGSLVEWMGYSREQFLDARVYKPSSTVFPADQDVADAYIETAAAAVGSRSIARLRIVNADGEPVPVLIFARGALPDGAHGVGVAGAVLDISHILALQGPSRLLSDG
jgi:hypothetical protein